MKKFFLMVVVAFVAQFINAQVLKGTWEYFIEDIPYRVYEKGVVSFKIKDNKTTAHISLSYESYVVELKKQGKSGYQASMYIDGSVVELFITSPENNKLKGKVNIDGIDYAVTFKKKQ